MQEFFLSDVCQTDVVCVVADEAHYIVDWLVIVFWQFIGDLIDTFCCTSAFIGLKYVISLDIFVQRAIYILSLLWNLFLYLGVLCLTYVSDM